MRLFFLRDDENQIVGLNMNGFRVNGIVFEKLQPPPVSPSGEGTPNGGLEHR